MVSTPPLTDQLNQINPDILKEQLKLLFSPPPPPPSITPFLNSTQATENPEWIALGRELAQSGKTATLLLAGGQGSRLGYPHPKGCYPISVVEKKSLFQLCAEKVVAAGHQGKRLLPLAIMTSPENDAAVRAYFQEHQRFGLAEEQLDFFTQEELPLLDEKGHVFLETPSSIAKAADGNGKALDQCMRSGILKKWISRGIELVQILPVDNPLADPCDYALLGFHWHQNVDISLRCVERSQPDEKVGLLAICEGKNRIVEYSELSETAKQERETNGRLKYRYANTGLLCFSISFILKHQLELDRLPLHKSWKKCQKLGQESWGWKFEYFIFDLIQLTPKLGVFLSDRCNCFAPLKNATGADSPQTVQEALLKRDQRLFEKIWNKPPPALLELPVSTYY